MVGSPVRARRRYDTARRGTTTPAGQASIFFTIPAELRLEVYKNLLEDCLENGFVMDVAGLFYACCQIHQEIESEFMAAVRPPLNAKSAWDISGVYPGVLSMKILPKLNSKRRSYLSSFRSDLHLKVATLKAATPCQLPRCTNCGTLRAFSRKCFHGNGRP